MKSKNNDPTKARVRRAAKRAYHAWERKGTRPGGKWGPGQDQARRRASWRAHRAAEAAWSKEPNQNWGFVAHNAACGVAQDVNTPWRTCPAQWQAYTI